MLITIDVPLPVRRAGRDAGSGRGFGRGRGQARPVLSDMSAQLPKLDWYERVTPSRRKHTSARSTLRAGGPAKV
jgi:hypothetical protein